MKSLCVGIFAHIDAGKTTLTERILLEGGALRKAGSVDGGTSITDFLPVEKRRGISVRGATASFLQGGVHFSLVDTPGHSDFFEETELSLAAVDVAVLVVSAREGVEAQTELLLELIAKRKLPLAVFINKCDMDGIDLFRVKQELRRVLPCETLFWEPENSEFEENAVEALSDERLLDKFLEGNLSKEELQCRLTDAFSAAQISPVLCGSAKTGDGVKELLALLSEYYDFKREIDAPFSAYVYQVEHRKNTGKIAHVRIFSGKVGVREEVFNRRTGSVFKAAQLKRVYGEKMTDESVLSAGEVGAITGLADVRAGDFLGGPPPVQAPRYFTPYLRIKITPKEPEKLLSLKAALEELSDESPSLALEWVPEKRELTVAGAGKVQTEILLENLLERFGLAAEAGAPSVVYRETPAQAAFGFEAYTMPKPCWAVVKFLIEPLPRGSGFVYESIASEKNIAYRYQEHVKTEVPRTLTQGLYGWQVTDLKVTLVDGQHHVQHTHPLDFFTATPMGIMDGLRNAGTILLEPVLDLRICAPEQSLGKVLEELSTRRAKLGAPVCEDGRFRLSAELPAEESFDLQERISSLTGGRGSCDIRLLGYFPCPEGHGTVRERVGVNPLDRAQWILHCRGAYKA